MNSNDSAFDWSAVIGKCLAYLCLNTEAARGFKTVLEKAEFLQKLGLPIDDVANLTGSTVASIRELQRQAKTTKAKKNGGKKRK